MLIVFILYVIFSSINFMDTYSEKAIEQFKYERNWNIGTAIVLFVLIYLAGGFSSILP